MPDYSREWWKAVLTTRASRDPRKAVSIKIARSFTCWKGLSWDNWDTIVQDERASLRATQNLISADWRWIHSTTFWLSSDYYDYAMIILIWHVKDMEYFLWIIKLILINVENFRDSELACFIVVIVVDVTAVKPFPPNFVQRTSHEYI